jgi:hypothetical protein
MAQIYLRYYLLTSKMCTVAFPLLEMPDSPLTTGKYYFLIFSLKHHQDAKLPTRGFTHFRSEILV